MSKNEITKFSNFISNIIFKLLKNISFLVMIGNIISLIRVWLVLSLNFVLLYLNVDYIYIYIYFFFFRVNTEYYYYDARKSEITTWLMSVGACSI